MDVRDQVKRLHALGPFPSEDDDSDTADQTLAAIEHALLAIERPLSDDEAALLDRFVRPRQLLRYGLDLASSRRDRPDTAAIDRADRGRQSLGAALVA
ncbi:hypothetical protein GCM10022255_117130 [Dactylosporangium darangshiense]|uniref:Uncharacterized protein n=1 Tax=Dactylosporangium darangshiense TaxID=579108 RepID=A0ABP8DWH1_9ACTN